MEEQNVVANLEENLVWQDLLGQTIEVGGVLLYAIRRSNRAEMVVYKVKALTSRVIPFSRTPVIPTVRVQRISSMYKWDNLPAREIVLADQSEKGIFVSISSDTCKGEINLRNLAHLL